MTEDQYKSAKKLKAEIGNFKGALDSIIDERNYLDLPQEMYDRHAVEKRAFLEAELARLEAAFAAL